MTEESTKPLSLFYCYAREDSALKDELDIHLSSLKRQNFISSWSDREISPGVEWKQEIDNRLNTAHIILLLISPHFMASDYCYGVEMQRALKRHDAGEARVIPTILRWVDWEDAPFSKLQVLPSNAEPVTHWSDRDKAFWDVTRGIRSVAKELATTLKTDIEWIEEGNTLADNKHYNEALVAYNHALTINHNNIVAYNNKGIALCLLKRYTEALMVFDNAISFYLDAMGLTGFNRGVAHLYLSAKDLIEFSRSRHLDPNFLLAYARVFYNKGKALMYLKRYEEAIAEFDRATALDLNCAEAYSNKGETLMHLKQYEEALKEFDQAIALDLDDAELYSNKGKALMHLRRYEEAVAEFDRAVNLDTYNLHLYIDMGHILRYLKCYREALLIYELAISIEPNSCIAYTGKGSALCGLDSYEEALEAHNQAIILDPTGALAYTGKGIVLSKLDRHEEALEAHKQAILLDPTSALVYTGIGSAFRSLRHYEQALNAYNQAIRLDSNNSHAYNGKGRTLYNLKRYKEALGAFKKAISLDPHNKYAYVGISAVYTRLNDRKSAQEYSKRSSSLYYKQLMTETTKLKILDRI
jgi:tetratricopeptide (TPR) repeat protein